MQQSWRDRWAQRRDDAGDTLVEILMAILVLSIAGLALMESFTTTITGSAQHRSLASNDLVLRAAAESAFSIIEQQTNPIYAVCHTSALYTSLADQYNKVASNNGDTNFGAPSSYVASITSVQFWDSTTDTWSSSEPSDCTTAVPELITMTVTNQNQTTESTSFTVNDLNASSGRSLAIIVASISPRQLPVGASSVPVTVTGSGFSPTSSVTFSNQNIGVQPSSTPNTSTSITVFVTIPLQNVPPGTYDVTVTTPASGSTPAVSGTGTALLQVTANANVIGVEPKTLSQGADTTGGPYTIYGTDFEAGMGVKVVTTSGVPSGVTVTNVVVASPTTATLTLTTSGPSSTPIVLDVNNKPLGDAFVVTLTGGVSSTSSPILQIIPPPTITSSANSTGGSPCDPGFDGTAGCVIIGTNFEAGATVTIEPDNGSQVGVVNSYSFVSSSEIDINVSGTGTVQGEVATILVTNPDGSSATLAGGFKNG